MTIGERIKNLREERDLKQKELAEALKISVSNISKYESNDMQPSIDVLKDIAKYFDVSSDYLIGLTAEKRLNEFIKLDTTLQYLPEEYLEDLNVFIKYLFYRNIQRLEKELGLTKKEK